jgi:hypothetical protein
MADNPGRTRRPRGEPVTDHIRAFTSIKNRGWGLLSPQEKAAIIGLEHIMSIYPDGYTIGGLGLITDALMKASSRYFYADGTATVSYLDPVYTESYPITDDRAESPSDSVEILWTAAGVKITVNFDSLEIANLSTTLSSAELVSFVEGMSVTGPAKNRAERRARQK